MADYKILLGVQLNTKDLNSQIKDINTRSKIKVDVKLNTKGISDQIKKINTKTPVKISMKLDTKNAQKQINNIKKQIQQLGNIKINLGGTVNNSINGSKNTIKGFENDIKRIKSLAKQMSKLEFKIGKLDANANINQIRELEEQLSKLRRQYNQTANELSTKGISGWGGSVSKEFVEAKNKLAEFEAALADAREKAAKGIKIKLDNGTFDNDILNVESKFNKLSNKSNEVEKAIYEVRQALKDMSSAAKSGDVDALIHANEEYEKSLKRVENQLKKNQIAQKDEAYNQALKDDRLYFQERIDAWLRTNSKAVKRFGSDMQRLRAQAEACDKQTLDHLEKEFKQVDAAADAAGLKMQKFTDRLRTQFSKYSSYFSAATVFMYASMGLRDMFEQVLAIDTAMTELKKVTDESDASYSKFLTNAASRASEIGTTIDGLVSSTADFARLGYSFESSQGLAEVANIYAVVGDEIDSVETATKSLISTFAAFKDEASGMSDADFAMDIVDKFNEVSNNFAISSGGIGEALQRSASSLFAANNSLDESIALITAANTVVQDPDVVGTALKTVSMRVRGAKTEMEEAGLETDGMAESTAKLREELLALSGVDIMLDKNTFKSTYQIMEELAAKWESLTDIQQASVTELIAGKRQGNIIASLMTNFDVAQDALETSLNSSGSAMAEHEKWMESLQAKLNQLKAAWQGFAQAFMSSNFLKGALDGLIKFLEILTKIIDKAGVLPTFFAAFAGFKVFSTMKTAGGISKLSDMLTVLSLAFPNAAKGASKLTGALKGVIVEAGGAGAALKNVGKSLLSLAGAHPVIATVAAAIAAVTIVASYQKKQAEELAKEVEETVSAYKDQHNALMELKDDFNTSNEASLASRYKELSKGVDGLGRNIALTADEYAEYQSVCNSIAESVPSLISGYDEQGNAILNCKGNVDELTAAYERLIHAQNQEVITNAGNIEKDWENTLENASGKGTWSNNHGFWAGALNSNLFVTGGQLFGGLIDYELKNDTVEGIKDLMNATDKAEKKDVLKKLRKDQYSADEIRDALTGAGIDVGTFEDPIDVLEQTIADDPLKVKNILDNYYAGFDEAVSEYKTTAEAILSEAFDVSGAISGLNYDGMSEELQAIAHQVVNSFDYDFLSELQKNGQTLENYVYGMLDDLNALSRSAEFTEIEAAFNLKTKFNDGDISFGGYVGQIREVEELINSLDVDEEVKSQIKLALDTEGVIEQYDTLKNRLTSEEYDIQLNTEEAETFLDGLTSQELSVLASIIPELSDNDINETVEDLKEAIEKELALEPVTITIEAETEKLEILSTAMSESLSGSGLTPTSLSSVESMFSSLSSYDPSKLFERTANGMRLNTTELSRLNTEYKKTNLASLNDKLSTLGDTYNETREELYGLTYGTDEYNAKAAELGSIEALINETETLITQYEGLTSAYQEWQMAESVGNQRDMYENVISGFETVKDELSRGWADDGTVEFLELITGETDLAGKSAKELKEVWDGLDDTIKGTGYSIRDFFTVDDEGNSTSKGVYNFLDAVGKLEEEAFGGKDVVQRDGKGNVIGFDFQTVGGDKVIAEALGISEELVQIMVRAADDAGFVISMDGTYQQLDVLKEKAQEASETLNTILEKNGKKGFDFNFNSADVDDITNQLKSAKDILSSFRNEDGTINMELKGAEEALTVASTLQSMLDNLTRPAYMDIQVSQVEDELKKPLEELQELRRLTETEHQLEITGADTSDLKASKEKIYEYFEGLDTDIKAEVGLVDDKGNPLSGQALRDKIDSGEIEIPATVDIQLEMDEKLGILVDKALLDAGIIDKKEFKKRVDVYLDADVDNEDAKEKTDKAVKEVADGKSGKSDSKDGKSSGGKVEKNVDVEVKADKVDTSDVDKKTDDAINGEVPTGADGRKMGMGVDVEVKAEEVDTSDVKNKTEEAVKEKSSEKLAIETKVELETTIEEATGLIKELENADKDIVIDVTVKGLDDVKELNENINITSNVRGDVDILSEYVESAKELSKLDDNISSFVTAEVKGNVLDTPEYMINNLKVFSDSAKGLKDVGTITSSVTADVKGSVLTTNEGYIDNLKVYSDSAKDISSIGTITSSVDASVSGNVLTTDEGYIENLKVYSDNAKDVGSIGNVVSSVNANIEGDVTDTAEYKINNLKTYSDSAKDVGSIGNVVSSVDANIEGNVLTTDEGYIENLKVYSDNAKDVSSIGVVESKVTANIDGDVTDTAEYKINNLKTYSDSAKNVSSIGTVESSVNAEVSGNVLTTDEGYIENLKVYSDNAKDVGSIGTVESSVNAEVSGNVLTTNEGYIENLKVYSDSAKGVNSIGEITSSVDAEVSGNVLTTNEGYIENLKTYSDSAKDVGSIGTVESSVTANIDGDVTDTAEYKINNLKVYSDSAKNVSNIGEVTSSVNAEVSGNVLTTDEGYIENLKVFSDNAKGIKSIGTVSSSVTADVEGSVLDTREGKIEKLKTYSDSAKNIKSIGTVSSSVNAEVSGNVLTTNEGYIENLKVFSDNAKGIKDVGSPVSTVTANIEGNFTDSSVSRLEYFKSVISGMSANQTVTISVTADVDSANIEKAISILSDASNSGVFKNYSATVSVGAKVATIDDSVVQAYIATPKTANGKVTWSNDTAVVDAFKSTTHTASGVVKWDDDSSLLKLSGWTATGKVIWDDSPAAGTAHSSGSAFAGGTSGRAFARGDWSIGHDGIALGGELGRRYCDHT